MNSVKKIFLMLVLLLTTVAAMAQTDSVGTQNPKIRNTFYGCTLGVTTKSQVVAKLKANRYNVKTDKEGYLYIEKVNFAGIQWDECEFDFYKDRLLQVGYGLNSTESTVKQNYTDLFGSLSNKYSGHLLNVIEDTENHKHKCFKDGSTIVSVSYVLEGTDNFNTLIYMDNNLVNQMDHDRDADL